MIDANPQPGQSYTWEELSAALRLRVDQWVPRFFPNGRRDGNVWRCADASGRAPHKNGSFTIELFGDKAGNGYDHANGKGGQPAWTLKQGSGLEGAELAKLAIEICGFPATRAASQPADREGRRIRDQAQAAQIWREAIPLQGTLAETYLRTRGIDFIPPGDLRFHSDVTDWETRTGEPALIARFTRPEGEAADAPAHAIHRVYLTRDGSWRTKKMMLGPVDGAVIRLAEPAQSGPNAGVLGIGTGIETTLAAMKLFGVAGWATASDGGMRKLGTWLYQLFSPASGSAPSDSGYANPVSDAQKRIALSVKLLLVWADRKQSGMAAAGEFFGICKDIGIPVELYKPQSEDDFAEDLKQGFYPKMLSEPTATESPPEIESDPLMACVNELNKTFSLINESGRAVIYEESYDPIMKRRVINTLGVQDFRAFFSNKKLTIVRRDGKSDTKTKAEWWLDHPKRREHLKGVGFDPTGKLNSGHWNLWRGPDVTPRQGDWSKMRNHIYEVICSGNNSHFDYMMGWISRMFQQPQIPGEVAVVLRGKRGTGKGMLFNHLTQIWGQHGIHIANADHLVGKFNYHLRDCIALFADEALFAGDRKHNSTLKALITEPTIPIEGKYKNVVNVPNMLHIMMASNEDWVIPAGLDERRYFVLDVANHRRGDREYFNSIYHEMSNGGLEAMYYDFLHYDISWFEVRNVPETNVLQEQKELTLDSLDRWWLDVLERGYIIKSKFGSDIFLKWHTTVSNGMLYQSYTKWCAENRVSYQHGNRQMGRRMAEAYGLIRPRGRVLIGEAESLAYGAVSAAIYAEHQKSYVLGTIEEAERAFRAARGLAAEHVELSEHVVNTSR